MPERKYGFWTLDCDGEVMMPGFGLPECEDFMLEAMVSGAQALVGKIKCKGSLAQGCPEGMPSRKEFLRKCTGFWSSGHAWFLEPTPRKGYQGFLGQGLSPQVSQKDCPSAKHVNGAQALVEKFLCQDSMAY